MSRKKKKKTQEELENVNNSQTCHIGGCREKVWQKGKHNSHGKRLTSGRIECSKRERPLVYLLRMGMIFEAISAYIFHWLVQLIICTFKS